MLEAMTKADGWFINLIALGGALYFLWSVKAILADLKNEIAELKETIKEIFQFRNDHEQRISRIEGICRGRRTGDSPAKCGD